jgi:hypothetical protein
MTITGPWHPLSARTAAVERLYEGVPHALADNLRHWIFYACLKPYNAVDRLFLRLHLRYVDEPPPEPEDDESAPVSYLHDRKRAFLAYRTPHKQLLDAVDALLDLMPLRPDPVPSTAPLGQWIRVKVKRMGTDHRRALQRLLDDARSVYQVSGDGRSLVRRADAMATLALGDTIAAAEANPHAGSAAVHLRKAWDTVYALHPDPPYAYSEAIKAVEAAAHAIIEPTNRKATLGTMLRELKRIPSQFVLALPGPNGDGVPTLIDMMQMLWTGQTSRHGNLNKTRDETRAEAQMAVHLAITLVQWFTSGAVSRQPGPRSGQAVPSPSTP